MFNGKAVWQTQLDSDFDIEDTITIDGFKGLIGVNITTEGVIL